MKPVRWAKVIIADANGDVLVLRRSGTHPRHAFKPDLPGGIVENGETFEAGVVRETLEETGLVLDELFLKQVNVGKALNKSVRHILFAIRLTTSRPDITISWEHDQFTWVSPGELYDLDLPHDINQEIMQQHELLARLGI